MNVAEKLAVVLETDHHHILLVSALEEYTVLLSGHAEDSLGAVEREYFEREVALIQRMIDIIDTRE